MMMMMTENNPDFKSKRLNIRLTPVLAQRFERAREKMGHSITDALIMLISQYCERAEKGDVEK